MSEQDQAAIEQPNNANTPEDGTGTQQEQQTNWEQRYQELQPAYTRAAQEAAELRQWQEQIRTDPDAQRALLSELGYAVEDDTPTSFDDDPLAALKEELRQEFQSELSQRDQAALQAQQVQQGEQYIAAAIAAINAERGTPLNPKDEKFVIATALTSPAGEDGMPDVMGAYRELEQRDQEVMQQWAQTKRTPHTVAANGAAGTEQPNLDDETQRVAWMAQRLQDLNHG